jgi:hypothetical protein
VNAALLLRHPSQVAIAHFLFAFRAQSVFNAALIF